jgi:hypothetical protein
MKKHLVLILIFLILSFNLFSMEKSVSKPDNAINFVSTSDTPALTNFSAKPAMKDPMQMIRLGQYLTFTGISSFSAGVLFTSLGVVFAYFACNELDPTIWNDTNKHSEFWTKLMMQKNNDKLTWLVAFAITSFTLGGLLSLLTILIIPGIVFWAVGAGARAKESDDSADTEKTSFKPFVNGNSIGLSIVL